MARYDKQSIMSLNEKSPKKCRLALTYLLKLWKYENKFGKMFQDK